MTRAPDVIVLTPDEYLDLRRPEWIDAETLGVIRFTRQPVSCVVIGSARPDILLAVRCRMVAGPLAPDAVACLAAR